MEEKLVISGGKELSGELEIASAKNSVLKHMAASLLFSGTVCIKQVPILKDVENMIEVLQFLGAKTRFVGNDLEIDSKDVSGVFAPHELVNKLRASFNVFGPLIGRFGEARVAFPGGCQIGARRLDLHEKGLKALGADISLDQGYMVAKAAKLTGAKIYLDLPSNGATENIMMAAILAEGETIIENAACDPEIMDLANFLNSIGGKIQGAGTHKIVINGVKQKDLHTSHFSPISDRLEAGTYLISAIATGGEIILKNVFPEHFQAVTSKLEEAGIEIKLLDSKTLHAKGNRKNFKAIDISTGWYPGFPTDLQPVLISLQAISKGTSTIKENIYEDRFGNVPDLVRMGADIKVNNNVAVIKGVETLSGTKVVAQDIRGGAGLVVAGLAAKGTTEITGLGFIDRGYENLLEKLVSIGANITRTKNISAEESSEENLHKEEKLDSKAKYS